MWCDFNLFCIPPYHIPPCSNHFPIILFNYFSSLSSTFSYTLYLRGWQQWFWQGEREVSYAWHPGNTHTSSSYPNKTLYFINQHPNNISYPHKLSIPIHPRQYVYSLPFAYTYPSHLCTPFHLTPFYLLSSHLYTPFHLLSSPLLPSHLHPLFIHQQRSVAATTSASTGRGGNNSSSFRRASASIKISG